MNNGAFQIARKIFESELWQHKPSSWLKIWVYILGKVNHRKKNGFERGEGFFNFTNEKTLIGNDITYNNIREFLRYARSCSMLDTKRSTRGVRLKVLNYNKYQGFGNYQTQQKTQAKHKPNTPINNNVKNDNNREQSSPKPLIDYFFMRCKKVKGYEPEINGGKDGKMIKAKLKKYAMSELKDLIDWFLEAEVSNKLGASISIAFSTTIMNQWKSRPINQEHKIWSKILKRK